MKYVELLAPGKDLESSIAAIKCGADAVYMGAEMFGARGAAGNTLKDIDTLISFAHKYRVKIYITLNTIMDDREILEAEKLINSLYNIGADAIIIQDFGLLELNLPPVPLIASTQMHNNTIEKIIFLEKTGFQRVILPRELSLEEIKKIRKDTNIELECFIHGSLCVSYSGQCYLSYAIGKRSGNRGVCAQPCRKVYSLLDGDGKVISENKYLLSLKDLNLSEYLRQLAETGVNSFKIEGRLKDINYVKNIVSFYRKKIDKLSGVSKTSIGKSVVSFTPDPERTFNRGYTDYFIEGRRKDITSFNTSKSTGKSMGKVFDVKNKYFTLNCPCELSKGDGICFFDEQNTLRGTCVNQIMGNKIFPENIEFIKNGITIYRNLDREFLKTLDHGKIERKISLNLYLSEKDKFLVFRAVDEDNIEIELELSNSFEMAKNEEMAESNIKKQLSKLGDTEFCLNFIEVKFKEPYFIPVKDLNEIRRKIVSLLIEKREKEYKRKIFKIEKNDYPYPEKEITCYGNVMNIYGNRFFKRHKVEHVKKCPETGLSMAGKKVMTTKHCLRYSFNMCCKEGNVNNPLYLVDEKGKKYTLRFNCKDCNMEIIF